MRSTLAKIKYLAIQLKYLAIQLKYLLFNLVITHKVICEGGLKR